MKTSLLAQASPPDFGSDGVDLGSTLSLGDGRAVRDVLDQPADLINLLIPNIFVLAGIILMLMIIVAGYKFIQGDSKGVEEAEKIATTALVGFIIMFSAYWIVQIVKIVTGANIPL